MKTPPGKNEYHFGETGTTKEEREKDTHDITMSELIAKTRKSYIDSGHSEKDADKFIEQLKKKHGFI
jgi:hypothetical protein